eukprot:14865638-Alexandrium_andersonii.AAC.1
MRLPKAVLDVRRSALPELSSGGASGTTTEKAALSAGSVPQVLEACIKRTFQQLLALPPPGG